MCFTRIYGFIFCDPKSINSSAIKNITRSGTTFTATRLNNGTFTFTQQDNNTTYANYKGATTAAAGTAGLVPAASTANRLKFLRGDGGWQVPTDTNTWRGIQNVLTSTSTTDSLSANMGKTLYDKLKDFMTTIYVANNKTSGSINAWGYITDYYSYTPPTGYTVTASIGTTMGYAEAVCTHSWYETDNKRMGATITNIKNSTLTFSASQPLTIQWAIIIKRAL